MHGFFIDYRLYKKVFFLPGHETITIFGILFSPLGVDAFWTWKNVSNTRLGKEENKRIYKGANLFFLFFYFFDNLCKGSNLLE